MAQCLRQRRQCRFSARLPPFRVGEKLRASESHVPLASDLTGTRLHIAVPHPEKSRSRAMRVFPPPIIRSGPHSIMSGHPAGRQLLAVLGRAEMDCLEHLAPGYSVDMDRNASRSMGSYRALGSSRKLCSSKASSERRSGPGPASRGSLVRYRVLFPVVRVGSRCAQDF